MLIEKQLGRIRAVHCYYTKGLLNNASHAIDLLHHWFSKEDGIKAISAEKSAVKTDMDASFVMYYRDFEAVFQCCGQGDYKIFEIDMIADMGRVQYRNFGRDVRFYRKRSDKMFPGQNGIDDKFYEIENDLNRYQYNVIDGIYNSIRDGRKMASDGVSAGDTLCTCLKVKGLCEDLR